MSEETKNNVYLLKIDANLDSSFKELQKQMLQHERIISTSVDGDRMVVTTEVLKQPKKILFDGLRKEDVVLDD